MLGLFQRVFQSELWVIAIVARERESRASFLLSAGCWHRQQACEHITIVTNAHLAYLLHAFKANAVALCGIELGGDRLLRSFRKTAAAGAAGQPISCTTNRIEHLRALCATHLLGASSFEPSRAIAKSQTFAARSIFHKAQHGKQSIGLIRPEAHSAHLRGAHKAAALAPGIPHLHKIQALTAQLHQFALPELGLLWGAIARRIAQADVVLCDQGILNSTYAAGLRTRCGAGKGQYQGAGQSQAGDCGAEDQGVHGKVFQEGQVGIY